MYIVRLYIYICIIFEYDRYVHTYIRTMNIGDIINVCIFQNMFNITDTTFESNMTDNVELIWSTSMAFCHYLRRNNSTRWLYNQTYDLFFAQTLWTPEVLKYYLTINRKIEKNFIRPFETSNFKFQQLWCHRRSKLD